MKMYQKSIMIGRTTNDMQFKFLPNGTPVANFNLAINREHDNGKADFIPCVVWGDEAKMFNENVGKGSLIFIEGVLKSRNFKLQLEVTNYSWLDLKPIGVTDNDTGDNISDNNSDGE